MLFYMSIVIGPSIQFVEIGVLYRNQRHCVHRLQNILFENLIFLFYHLRSFLIKFLISNSLMYMNI